MLSVLISAIAVAADPPSVSSFVVTGSPSSSGTLTFSLAFSAPVSGLEPADLTTDGSATGCLVGAPAGGPQEYSVTVSGCSEGTLGLVLAAGSVGLVGEESTVGPLEPVSSAVGVIDKTAPTVQSFGVTSATPVSGPAMDFALTFSEPVTGLDASSFRIFPESGQPWSVTGVAGSGDSYTISLGRTTSTAGTVTLRLRRDSVSDLAGNVGPPAFVEAPSVSYTAAAPSASLTINAGAASTSDPTLVLALGAAAV